MKCSAGIKVSRVRTLPGPHQAFRSSRASFMRPAQNRHRGPKAGTLCSRRSPKPGGGSTTSGSAAFRHEQEWPAFFWSAERRGAGAIVGYGRGVPADRDGFALWRQINFDKTGCTSRFPSVRRYSRWMPSCVAVIYSVGGCPGRCDRLPHWELSCLRFRWVTFNRGRRLMHEAFWLPGH